MKYILSREDEVVIGVGSAQYSHTFENPLTAGERIEVIYRTLKASGVDLGRCFITPIPDLGEHMLWVSRVRSFCPSFQTVYSNNPLVARLFSEAGYQIRPVPLFEREKYMATEIRKKIAKGDDWRSLVHPAAYEYLVSIGLQERIRYILADDHSSGGG